MYSWLSLASFSFTLDQTSSVLVACTSLTDDPKTCKGGLSFCSGPFNYLLYVSKERERGEEAGTRRTVQAPLISWGHSHPKFDAACVNTSSKKRTKPLPPRPELLSHITTRQCCGGACAGPQSTVPHWFRSFWPVHVASTSLNSRTLSITHHLECFGFASRTTLPRSGTCATSSVVWQKCAKDGVMSDTPSPSVV
jgi:hypothetical protein